MAIGTTGSGVFEVQGVDGIWLPLMLVPTLDDKGRPQHDTFEEALAASDADAALGSWLHPTVRETWSRGMGLDYDAAICVDTWSSPGRALPAGAPTSVTLPASGNSASPLVAFSEFGTAGDLFVAQRGTTLVAGRVIRSPGGSGAGAGLFANSLTLSAGEYLRDLVVADNGFGVPVLWATSSSITAADGRLHKWDGATWTSTAALTFGGWGRNRMAEVMWTGNDGVSAKRLVVVSSNQGHISYTRPGSDPMLAASWVEGIGGGIPAPDAELAVARRHVYLNLIQNLYDLNEHGDLLPLTSYTMLQRGNGLAVWYLDGWVYRSLGDALDRVWVGEPGVLQSNPGVCSPGWGTRSESGWGAGYITALHQHQGYLLAAVYNVALGNSSVYRGKDRTVIGIETPNPLVWHGPEAITSENCVTTRMHVASAYDTPYQTKLWLATWNVSQLANPKLDYVSLPTTGAAFAELASGGPHRYATGAAHGSSAWQPYVRLIELTDSHGDKASTKYPYQATYGTLLLGGGTKLTAAIRADPPPGSGTWPAGLDIPSGPTYTVTEGTTTSGQMLQSKIDFISPNGAATPPVPAILESVRRTAWRTVPDLDTRTLQVRYGSGVVDLWGADFVGSGRSVRWMTDQLIALCRGNRTTIRDRNNNRWTVKFRQILPRRVVTHDAEYGGTMEAELTFAVVAQL